MIRQFFDFSKTKLSFSRPLGSYSKIQFIYSSLIRSKKFQLKKIANTNKKYLNIGCGDNIFEHFINLDFQWRPNIDICWDIVDGIPAEDDSLTGIYTEHCLEHITYGQCLKVLNECRRSLKSNGVIRIVVPDAELYIDLYTKSKNGEKVSFPYNGIEGSMDGSTPVMAVNRIFNEHGHKFAYDYETLALLLKKAGFGNIQKRSFRVGYDDALLIDTERRMAESLYVEAVAMK